MKNTSLHTVMPGRAKREPGIQKFLTSRFPGSMLRIAPE
jgi:hypothetical protein